MHTIYTLVNEELVPADQASLRIPDLALQRGYGIFDYFKIVNGKPVFLEDHLDRFFHSAKEMDLPVGKTRDGLKEIIFQLTGKNNLPFSGVRISLTGGYSPDGYTIATPNLFITQHELQIPGDVSERGIKLVTFEHQRQLATVKTLDYLMAIKTLPYVKSSHADDILYYSEGVVRECPRANFFIVTKEGAVKTSASNLLKGVIRKQVLKLAADLFTAEENNITLNDLREAEEAFITSTSKNVLPVLAIDGRAIGNARPGKITVALGKALQNLIP